MTDRDFMTEAEFAELLGVTKEKMRGWRVRHGWPHLKIGRDVRYTEADVETIKAMHHIEGQVTEPLTPRGALRGQSARSAAYWAGRR